MDFPSFTILRELAERFDLALADTGVDYAFREGVGREGVGPRGASVEAQQRFLAEARAALVALGEDERRTGTVGGFLDRLPADDAACATLCARYEGTCAFDLDRVSLAMAAEEDLLAVGASGPCARLAGGNQGLAFAMAGALPDVRLGQMVDGIEVSATRAYGRARSCVTAFAGGEHAIQALGLDRGHVGPWLDLVRAMHPDLTLAGEPVVYVWGDDPFTLGAYVAWDRRSYERAAVLREPVGRLLLAGEHTATDGFRGTMEGALRSGRRAAAQALAALCRPPGAGSRTVRPSPVSLRRC